MNFDDLNPPYIELPSHYVWYRIQRLKARFDSVRTRGFVLAPPGPLSGRFALFNEPTAYLADTERTALYEPLFRREVRSCHLDQIKARALVTFRTKDRLRLVDLRGLEERYPVLQSLRYETTQAFAASCRQSGAHGDHLCLGPAFDTCLHLPVSRGGGAHGAQRKYFAGRTRHGATASQRCPCRAGIGSTNHSMTIEAQALD